MSFVTTRSFHVLAGKLEAKRSDCAPVAGKSTLNRLEHRLEARGRESYHKIDYDAPSLEALFVDIFLDGSQASAEGDRALDLDATDDTIHGEQEGRFFHGYYDSYCYLPALHGTAAGSCSAPSCAPPTSTGPPARSTRSPGSSPASGPAGRRCGSCCAAIQGFCREELMAWCEAEGVAYLFGLAPNSCAIRRRCWQPEAWEAARLCRTTGKAAPAVRGDDSPTRQRPPGADRNLVQRL